MAQSQVALRAVFRRRAQCGGGQDCGSPVPPHPNPLPEERESAGTALEYSDVTLAVPRFFVFRFGGTRQPSSVVLPKHGRMFLPLLGERVGVRGNEANSNPRPPTVSGTAKLRESPGRAGALLI